MVVKDKWIGKTQIETILIWFLAKVVLQMVETLFPINLKRKGKDKFIKNFVYIFTIFVSLLQKN
jgi:hypothetical protein